MTHIQETSASATRLLGEPIVEITNVDSGLVLTTFLKMLALQSGKAKLWCCVDALGRASRPYCAVLTIWRP